MIISAHCLVKNEENFIWYTVMSVIDYVDQVCLWDTGSNDQTGKIIGEIMNSPLAKGKISFKQLQKEKYLDEQKIRQDMIDATVADWFLVVDGDEVWWEDSIKKVVETIKRQGDKLESIVVPTYNLVGDIFHYQERRAGKYHLAGRVGHYSLRAVNRKIPGLHAEGEYGQFGWVDGKGKFVENRDPSKIRFLNAPYLHATHLPRAGSRLKDEEVYKRKAKLKYEIGIPFPLDFYFPEVFFRPKSNFVPSPWRKLEGAGYFRAAFETPFKKLKRIL